MKVYTYPSIRRVRLGGRPKGGETMRKLFGLSIIVCLGLSVSGYQPQVNGCPQAPNQNGSGQEENELTYIAKEAEAKIARLCDLKNYVQLNRNIAGEYTEDIVYLSEIMIEHWQSLKAIACRFSESGDKNDLSIIRVESNVIHALAGCLSGLVEEFGINPKDTKREKL
jgi:hypothetical protein